VPAPVAATARMTWSPPSARTGGATGARGPNAVIFKCRAGNRFVLLSSPLAFSDYQKTVFAVVGRLLAKLGPTTPLERRGSSCSAGWTQNQPRRPILKRFRVLADHWHSRIRGFYLRPWPGNPQNPAPEDRIPALRARGNLCFSLGGVDDFSPGLEAGWGTSFGTLWVSR
jgi:hypothetical protein